MESGLVAELRRLQRQRSEAPQFPSKLEFTRWADQVAGLLAFDEKARYRFVHYVKLANFKYNTDASPLDAINEAIGTLNQVLVALEHKATPAPEVAPIHSVASRPSIDAHLSKEHWYGKPVGLVGIGVF